MPKQYEAIRDNLVDHGKSMKEAQSEAAATYNKQHPGHPMRPDRDNPMNETATPSDKHEKMLQKINKAN